MALGGQNHVINTTFTAQDKASASINNLRKNVASLGGPKFGPLGNLVSGMASMPGPALAASVAIGAFTKIIFDSIGKASDLNETLNKSQVVFGSAASEIQTFGEGAAKNLGLSTDAAVGAAATFGNLFKSLGTAPSKIAPMSESLVTLAADLASFNNIPVEEALAKLQSGIVGQERPLRELGVAISAASVDVQAATMGFHKLNGTFSEGEKVQARYALIFQQTGTAQGDFARTSTGLANSQRIVSAEMENLQTKIGQGAMQLEEALIPALLSAIDGVGALVGAVGELGTAFDNLHRFIDPAYAKTQDLNFALKEQAVALGLNADVLVNYNEQQKKLAADALEASNAAQANIDRQKDLGDAYGSQVPFVATATDAMNANTTATADAAKQAADSAAAFRAAGAEANILGARYGHSNEIIAATIARTKAAVIPAYSEIANAAIESDNKIRAGNKSLEDSYNSLGTNFKDDLKQMAQDAKTGLANIRYIMHHDGTETKKVLQKDMREAVKLRNEALRTGNTRALAALDVYIADVQAKMNNLNMTQTITTVWDHRSGGGPHVSGAGRAAGGPVSAYTAYTVGERGPETLLMGGQSGTIVPSGGMAPINVYVDGQKLFQIMDKRQGRALQVAARTSE
jgi:hypothetical protein